MVIFMGIDQSLTGTGVCVLKDKELVLLTTLKQKVTPKNETEEVWRLKCILTELIQLLKEHNPDYVGMEDYGFMTKGRAFKLGELGGIIKLSFFERGKMPTIFKATTLKKYLTGKGNAEKNLVLMNVYKKYGIECKNDNEADALNIAKLLQLKHEVEKKIKNKKDFTQAEWDVLKVWA